MGASMLVPYLMAKTNTKHGFDCFTMDPRGDRGDGLWALCLWITGSITEKETIEIYDKADIDDQPTIIDAIPS